MPAGSVLLALAAGAVALVFAWVVVAVRARWSRRGMEPGASSSRTAIGPYRLVSELGRGAMGTVYLADSPAPTRPVALKTLVLIDSTAGDEDGADAATRFFREAEAARRLRHPDIVAVFDSGVDGEIAYLAMELASGSDLQAWIRPGSLLPVQTVLRTVARVAAALDHAHRLGVVHRDIKPANVMLDLDTGAVKVTDFGIARLVDAECTRTGTLLGTPFYMAPEQLTGARVDGRTDLYSLGVMLHELLTGKLPYRPGSTAELLRQIAEAPPPDVRACRAALPQAVADIVTLALQKRPALRYQNGLAFAEDLNEAASRMADEPTGASSKPVAP